MTWATVASATLDTDFDSGGTLITYRELITAAALSNTGLALCRVTFSAGSAQGLKISKAYIAQAADSGDAYDFIGTPTPMLFSGVANCQIEAGASKVTDTTIFTIPTGKNIVISWAVPADASYDNLRALNVKTGWKAFYKGGDDAATVNATGYTDPGGYEVIGISLVEASYNGGQVIIWSSE